MFSLIKIKKLWTPLRVPLVIIVGVLAILFSPSLKMFGGDGVVHADTPSSCGSGGGGWGGGGSGGDGGGGGNSGGENSPTCMCQDASCPTCSSTGSNCGASCGSSNCSSQCSSPGMF